MNRPLKHLASIQSGLFAQTEAEGDAVYLQSKHFDENGQLQSKLHPDLYLYAIPSKHILKQGDVLFSSKGTKNIALAYSRSDFPAVASTSFFVIRLHGDQLLPEFLAWFLNHPSAQSLLKSQASGTSIASISKSVLEELAIPIPSIEVQTLIQKITSLRIRERELQRTIDHLRETQIQQSILNALL